MESQQRIPDHIIAPKNIRLKVSDVDHSRIGAFCVNKIVKGTEFGPFVGRKVYSKEDGSVDQRYSWEVFDLETFKYQYTVDATSPADGNWMRYVCCARYFEEQNIVSTQNGNQVYYKALQDIGAGEELLTWYQPKKKHKKRSSWKTSTETDKLCVPKLEPGETSAKPSTGMSKRRRKPKIIPDSYDGPFDFEEHETVEIKEPKPPKPTNRDDLFEPLQPGQKRRRRKKFSEATDSTSTSKAGSPERDLKTPSEDSLGEKPLVIDFADDNNDEEYNGTKRKESDPKKSNYSKTINDINETVEWEFPEKGEEYSFELLKHHILYQGGKKVYKCDICLGLYKHMFSLKRHYLRNHINYKYLSKADLTNCLINLAQAKLNMSHFEKKDGKDDKNDLQGNKITESDNSNISESAHVNNGEMENVKQSINKSGNLTKLKEKPGDDNKDVAEDKHLSSDKLRRKSSEVSMDTDGCEDECSNSLNSSSNSLNSLQSSSCSNNSRKSLEWPDVDKGEDSNFSIPNGLDKPVDINNKEESEFPGLFKCYTCSEVFDRKAEIRAHLQDHPTKEGMMFPCDRCNMFFSFKHNLVRHQRNHDSEKSRSPTPVISKKRNMEQGNEPSPSKQSGVGSSSNPDINSSDKTMCTPKVKKEVQTGTHHHTPHKVYKCGICPFRYDNQEALVKHVENKHKNGSKFQCKYCGKDFLSMPNMKKHVRFHLGYRATCRECKDTFSNVGALRKHTRVAHPEVYRARLVERLEKFGVLRGPDKNALKQKIVDKIVEKKAKAVFNNTTESVKNSNKVEKENKSETVENKGTEEEFPHETEISFAADEIDDGGSRFKFSCTVCKKRFSSYINMCRHRRKAHSNDIKTRTDQQSLPYGQQSRTQSPIVENPDEIAAFYANVSHNIATNINCYIDGRLESLENFVDHIKVEGYSGNFGYGGSEVVTDGVAWDKYNFPPDFKPGQTVSYSEINRVLDIPSDLDARCTKVGARKGNKSDSEASDDSDSDVDKLEIVEQDPTTKEDSEHSIGAAVDIDKAEQIQSSCVIEDKTELENIDPVTSSAAENSVCNQSKSDTKPSVVPVISSQIATSTLALTTQQVQVLSQQSVQNLPFILSQPILSTGSILPSPAPVSQVRFPVNQVAGVPGQFILPLNQAGPVLSHPLVVNQPLVLNQPNLPSHITIPINQGGVTSQITVPVQQGGVPGQVTLPFSQIAGSSQISLPTQIVLPVSSQIAFPVLPSNLPQTVTALATSVSCQQVVLNQPPVQVNQLPSPSISSTGQITQSPLVTSQTSTFTSAVNLVQVQNLNQNLLSSIASTGTAGGMGIASYGMKMLSSLVAGKKAPPDDGQQTTLGDKAVKQMTGQEQAQFFKLRIADGVILNPESPAARTFNQVQKGEYASFQDDLCPETDSILNGGHLHRPRAIRSDGQLFNKEYYYMQSIKHSLKAQAELDSLYADIDLSLDESSEPVPKTPRRLSRMCEDFLGISPNSKWRLSINTGTDPCQPSIEVKCKPSEHDSDEEDSKADNADALKQELEDESMRWLQEERPDYSDAPEESPFHNYDTIAFGKHGNIQSVCATCKKPFKDFDSLVRHHVKKHPASVCGMLEIEKGNGIEDLHFVEPSCVGTLAVTDPGLDAANEVDSFKCTYCGAAFKTVNKLHVHIVNCSPIDPVYGSQKSVNIYTYVSPKKKTNKDKTDSENTESTKDYTSPELSTFSTRKPGCSRKRIFTGCRKWTSVILPDSPVKESTEPAVTAPEKSPQLVISGYNPLRHVRRRELTEVVDLLTCEGCGLKCKTIILLERHVRHCTRKEKFRTMKPLTCPIIDESQDKMKNMCFYCEKNFTYTKSLINHFQDFCPVKKAKLDRDEISEEDKQREAAILDRIQKGEEEKLAQKEKELENGTKRRITWQVGRKPKKKGNAWTIIKRRQSQQDEDGNVGDDEEGVENEDRVTNGADTINNGGTGETNEEKICEPTDEAAVDEHKTTKAEPTNQGSPTEENIDDEDSLTAHVSGNTTLENDKPALKGKGREKKKTSISQEEASPESIDKNNSNNKEADKTIDDINEEPDTGDGDMNTSLNCTVRYQVNQKVKPVKERKTRDVSKGSVLFQCVSTQNLAAEATEEIQESQKKRTRSTQPDSSRIVEGKRKRERVGKVEEFLRNAFSRKRKRKYLEDAQGSEKPVGELNDSTVNSQSTSSPALASLSSAPVIALATPGVSGQLAVTSLVFLPNGGSGNESSAAGNQKSFQPIRPAVCAPNLASTGPQGNSVNGSSLDGAPNKDHNDAFVSPTKGKRGRPRKYPIVTKPIVPAINPETGKRRPGRPRKLLSQSSEEQNGDSGTVNNQPKSEMISPKYATVARNDSADDEQVVPDLDIKKEVHEECAKNIKQPDASADEGAKGNFADIEDKTDDVDGDCGVIAENRKCETPHFEIRTHIENNVICTTEVCVISDPINQELADNEGETVGSSAPDESMVVPTRPDKFDSTDDNLDNENESVEDTNNGNEIANDVVDGEMDFEHVNIPNASDTVKAILLEKLNNVNFRNKNSIGDNEQNDDDDDDKSDATPPTERYDSSRESSPDRDIDNSRSIGTDNAASVKIEPDNVAPNIADTEKTDVETKKTESVPCEVLENKIKGNRKFEETGQTEIIQSVTENDDDQVIEVQLVNENEDDMKSDTNVTDTVKGKKRSVTRKGKQVLNKNHSRNSSGKQSDTECESSDIDGNHGNIKSYDSIECRYPDDAKSIESGNESQTTDSEMSDFKDDYGEIKMVLSPGERVKMNKRSCKKEVDLASPVWVKRTKYLSGGKTDRQDQEQNTDVKVKQPKPCDGTKSNKSKELCTELTSDCVKPGKKSESNKSAQCDHKSAVPVRSIKADVKGNDSQKVSGKGGKQVLSEPAKGRKRKEMDSKDNLSGAMSKVQKCEKEVSSLKTRSKR